MGPILATGFGFSTGIQNQLAVLYRLSFAQSEGKMRADLSPTYGGKQRSGALHKHTCISFSVFTGQFVIVHLTDQ